MITGSHVRNAIRSRDLTMEDAAKRLGMSRQNLYFQVNKGYVNDDFLQLLKERLGIDLTKASQLDLMYQVFARMFNKEIASQICDLVASPTRGPKKEQLKEILNVLSDFSYKLDNVTHGHLIDQLRGKFRSIVLVAYETLEVIQDYAMFMQRRSEIIFALAKQNPQINPNEDEGVRSLEEVLARKRKELEDNMSRLARLLGGEVELNADADVITLPYLFDKFYHSERIAINKLLKSPVEDEGEALSVSMNRGDFDKEILLRIIALENQLAAIRFDYAKFKESMTKQPAKEIIEKLDELAEAIGQSIIRNKSPQRQ